MQDWCVYAGDRHLSWEGCFNVRDLGGLPTRDGGRTRAGAVIRSDSVDNLTDAGWEAMRAHGVRTVVDLRNDDEVERFARARAAQVPRVRVPIDDVDDAEFWRWCWDNDLDGSPLYFRPFLERKAGRCVAAVTAVAEAAPGGVVVHCGVGRDRTGLVSLLLLSLAGVDAEHIADDYEASRARLTPAWSTWGIPDQQPEIDAALGRHRTTARDALLSLLADLDVEARLRAAGLTDAQVTALRARLVE